MCVRYFLVCAVVCLVASGCGGSKVKRDPVFPVSGTVTYKGQPVTGADVTFTCDEKNRSAFGRTDDAGKFKLSTFGQNDGAVPGKHIVVVSKIEVAPPTVEADISSTDYVPPTPISGNTPSKTPPKHAIPAKYSKKETSDQIVVVSEGGSNEVTVELKD